MSLPTLAELKAQSTGGDGWACPRCGCHDWRVEDSYWVPTAGERRRRRFCRHCKQVLHTREVPIEPASASHNPANGNDDGAQLTRPDVVPFDGTHDDSRDHRRRDRTNRARTG